MAHAKARFVQLSLVVSMLSATPLAAVAQAPPPTPTFDSTKHFRGGAWEQWQYWIAPGPAAQAAIVRKLAVVNAARAEAGFPPLNYVAGDAADPIIVAFYEEHDPRGPDGAFLADNTPNREMFIGTFVNDGTAGYVLFLEDQIRSNAALTAKGVPGRPGTVHWKVKRDIEGAAEETTTSWSVTSPVGDKVDFKAEYHSSDINIRSRSPSQSRYLAAGMGLAVQLIWASRPTQVFRFYERAAAAILSLAGSNAEVSLKARHHDPDLDIMLNDPANQPDTLFEFRHRVVRIETQ
jgi:hypothetical protein